MSVIKSISRGALVRPVKPGEDKFFVASIVDCFRLRSFELRRTSRYARNDGLRSTTASIINPRGKSPMLTLHHLNDSRSQRILWLLEELGTPYEMKRYQRD